MDDMFCYIISVLKRKRNYINFYWFYIDNIYWMYGFFLEFIRYNKVMCNKDNIIILRKCVYILDKLIRLKINSFFLFIFIKWVFYFII